MKDVDNYLEKMFPELLNGVEYKTLGEVCKIEKGVQFNKENMSDEGSYPVINGGINPSGYIEQYNQNENTITISQGGASAGYVNWIDKKFWAGAHCYVLKPNGSTVQNRYIFHFIKSKEYKLQECQYGAGIPALAKSTVAELQIPVPPLPVQEEIVRILDKFTSLTAELTARRKQYEYYRDALLTPPFGSTTLTDRREHFGSPKARLLSNVEASEYTRETKVKFFKLKDLCKSIKDGMHNLPKSSLESGDYPILSAQNIYNNQIDYNAKRFVNSDIFVQENKRTNVEEGDVLLTIVATIGRSAVVKENRKVLLQRSVCALKPNEKVLPGYLKYSLDKSEIQNYMIKNAHGSAQAGLYLNQVEEITIPLPPLSVQQRIVNVLDNFDAICSDLEIGLPAEIDARKRQYEYYRDLLLTFAERGNTIRTEQNRTEQMR